MQKRFSGVAPSCFFVDDGVGRVGHEVEVACRQTAFRLEKRVFCDDLVVLAVVIVRI